MKRYAVWLLLTIIASIAGGGGAVAQEAGVDPNADCAAVLAAPPFVDVLTKNEGRDFRELSSQNSGRALLGLECSVDELTAYFEDAGWELTNDEEQTHAWVDGKFVRVPENVRKSMAYFCFKRPTIFGMFDFRCRAFALVRFQGVRVFSLSTGISK